MPVLTTLSLRLAAVALLALPGLAMDLPAASSGSLLESSVDRLPGGIVERMTAVRAAFRIDPALRPERWDEDERLQNWAGVHLAGGGAPTLAHREALRADFGFTGPQVAAWLAAFQEHHQRLEAERGQRLAQVAVLSAAASGALPVVIVALGDGGGEAQAPELEDEDEEMPDARPET
jgi:hypothetical protein